MSNFTDLDALAAEPGVRVRFTRSAADVERADLVVVPGTKATVEDLERLRADGLDARARRARRAPATPILGICGGYQLLGERIDDDVESGARRGRRPRAAAGRDALRAREGPAPPQRPLRAGSAPPSAATRSATAASRAHGGEPLIAATTASPTAAARRALGTSWHGALEHDAFRRALLRWVAARARASLRPRRRHVLRRRARAPARRPRRPRRAAPRHRPPARADRAAARPPTFPTIQTEVRPCCAS